MHVHSFVHTTPTFRSVNGLLMHAMTVAPSLRRRMACWLYEGVLMFGVVFLPGYLFGTLSQTHHALDNRHALQAFMFLVLGIYFVWFWAKGQTLAMKTWNIRIVDAQGNPLTQQRALLRYVYAWVWFLPPLLVAYVLQWPSQRTIAGLLAWIVLWAVSSRWQAQRQFWHDIAAGTRLVSSVPPNR